jgi:hypothetical protein
MKLCRVKHYVTVWRHSAIVLALEHDTCWVDPLVRSAVGCTLTTVDVNIKYLRNDAVWFGR